MKENKLSGFSPVFRYTFKRNLTSRKFLVSTIIIGTLLLLGVAFLILVFGKPDAEKKGLQIGMLQIYDETGLGIPDYKEMAAARKETEMEKVSFEEVKDARAAIRDGQGYCLLAIQTETGEGYQIKLVSGGQSGFEDSDLEYLGKQLSIDFQNYIYQKSGLSEEALAKALMPVVYEVSDFEESGQDQDQQGFIFIVVCAVMLIIYMMVIFYGQQICAEVSQEKVTKLVEQLLVSVTPYGLVSGKILAVILTSILQFVSWIACAFLGVFAGDFLCGQFYDGYASSISLVFSMVNSILSGYSLEPAAIVLGIALMLLGLIFYLAIAGMAGSMVNRPDEAGNMQGLFMMPVIISFFVALYMLSNGAGEIGILWYLLPFTGAMLTPGAVMVGMLSLPLGLLCLAVCILCSAFLLWIAAKAYKALLFYSGDKLTPGKAFKIIFGKK